MPLSDKQRYHKRIADRQYAQRKRAANRILALYRKPEYRFDQGMTDDVYAEVKRYFRMYGHQLTMKRLADMLADTLSYREGNPIPGRQKYFLDRPEDDDENMWWYH